MSRTEGYDDVNNALQALKSGKFILLHDSISRENEVDMVVAGEFVSPEHIKIMRKDAGGLLCLALDRQVTEDLGLAYMHDILRAAGNNYPILRSLEEESTPYGGKPAFSITLNHRKAFTGVTDHERALTIAELAHLVERGLAGDNLSDLRQRFADEFKAPGHVHLLMESKGSLHERRGHTELSVYLCRLAGTAPAAAICEMLDGTTYRALSIEDAAEYSKRNSIPLLDGQRVIAHFLEQEQAPQS
ncbi:MAG: 3,4-dihydroxy-2-butanone-4-phosphate synthase [Nitrososphaerota archaeon]|nr:3,4-dihydroxy-2-butanone-4-phosphate synthase [Nitrososphaerota archaeon]